MRETFVAATLPSTVLVAVPLASVKADAPGLHPFYRHAHSDLRYARSLISHGTAIQRASANEAQAIYSISDAIGDLKAAGADDGKPMQ